MSRASIAPPSPVRYVFFLEPQAHALYQDLMLSRGGNAGQVKPPHIVVNEFQRRFFFGLSDCMYECVS